MKYRRKPEIVDAVQWKKTNYKEVCNLVGKELDRHYLNEEDTSILIVENISGKLMLFPDNYLVRYSDGKLNTYTQESFRREYEMIQCEV